MFIAGTWSQEPLKKVLNFMATAINCIFWQQVKALKSSPQLPTPEFTSPGFATLEVPLDTGGKLNLEVSCQCPLMSWDR